MSTRGRYNNLTWNGSMTTFRTVWSFLVSALIHSLWGFFFCISLLNSSWDMILSTNLLSCLLLMYCISFSSYLFIDSSCPFWLKTVILRHSRSFRSLNAESRLLIFSQHLFYLFFLCECAVDSIWICSDLLLTLPSSVMENCYLCSLTLTSSRSVLLSLWSSPQWAVVLCYFWPKVSWS